MHRVTNRLISSQATALKYNVGGVMTNIDTIPKIFPGLFYKPGEN